MGGKKFATRDTFAKGAGGTMRHTSEMQTDGKWTPLGDETCQKAREVVGLAGACDVEAGRARAQAWR